MTGPGAVHVVMLGTLFRVESSDAAVTTEVRRLWRPLLTEPGDVAADRCFTVTRSAVAWTAWRGGTSLGSETEMHALVTLLSTHLNTAAIVRAHDLVLHAGAIAHRGDVVALAAPSGGGKTTLTAACVALGWDYVSDEALHLREHAVVSAYPKPLALSAWSRHLLGVQQPDAEHDGERAVSVDDLGGSVADDRLQLREVVFLGRSHDRTRAAVLQPLHPSEVLTGLLALSFNHYKDPVKSLQLLAAAAERCRAWRLHYADARQAAALLSDSFPDGPAAPCRSG